MEAPLGGRLKTDKLKLSDFIDESFFEDIEDNNNGNNNASSNWNKKLSED